MFEANSSLLMLALAATFAVQARWPRLPRRARWALCAFLLLSAAASWWWTIRLPIGRELGFVLAIVSGLSLLVTGLVLVARQGPPYPKATPDP